MRLIQDGTLRLDQPVTDVIPEWKSLRVAVDPQKSLESRPLRTAMTMRHLLTHTSGLAYWIPAAGSDLLPTIYRERGITPGDYYYAIQGRLVYGSQVKTLSEMVARLAELPLATDPGSVYLYSVAYDVLGLIVERVSGKSLDAYCREQIFDPLKMTSSGFQIPASQATRLTTNYEVSADGLTPIDRSESSVFLQRPSLVAGGAGLLSTARDFARFTGMLLGHGTYDGAQVLRTDTARLACSNLLPEGVVSDFGYGARHANHEGPKGTFMAIARPGRHSQLRWRDGLPVDGGSCAARHHGFHDAAHATSRDDAARARSHECAALE